MAYVVAEKKIQHDLKAFRVALAQRGEAGSASREQSCCSWCVELALPHLTACAAAAAQLDLVASDDQREGFCTGEHSGEHGSGSAGGVAACAGCACKGGRAARAQRT